MPRLTTCIFCEIRRDLSKEHIWPKWLAPHLPIAAPNSHITEFLVGEGKEVPKLERHSQRPGALHSRKVRAVCRKCNNGWMSGLESQVKEIILGLLARDYTSLNEVMQRHVAAWLALKSIVAEHSASGALLTPQSDRTALMSGAIPDYFRIFAAFHSLTPDAAYYRHSATISLTTQGPVPPLPEGITRNTELVMFKVGVLCFYVTAIRLDGLDRPLLDPDASMLRLWPLTGGSIDLASVPPLDALKIEIIGKSLDRLIAHPQVRYAGPLSI